MRTVVAVASDDAGDVRRTERSVLDWHFGCCYSKQRMDSVITERMTQELTGKQLAGWTLEGSAGHGKSAIVFRASRGTELAAVKIFDREMVERFGREAQLERVKRERSLVGKVHPHVIRVLDAGEDPTTGYFFVAMDFFSGATIAEALPNIPAELVPAIIAQLADAAQFLEGLGLAHRDIKPDNIGITDDFSRIVLLDLGVVRPIGLANITDEEDQKRFIGTLQYSPRELLMREEQDSIEGWRAVTFYQMGAVLHDLLTRRPLFAGITPYGRLVEAVNHETPPVHAPGTPADLRLLAQNCLVKSPATRLALVSWESFSRSPSSPGDVAAAAGRIAMRLRQIEMTNPGQESHAHATATARFSEQVLNALRGFVTASPHFPPVTVNSACTASAFEVSLHFSREASKAVTRPFSMLVLGTLIDPQSSVCRVSAACRITRQEQPARSSPPEEYLICAFEGPYNEDALRERLEALAVLVLDAAQESMSQPPAAGVEDLWVEIPYGSSHAG